MEDIQALFDLGVMIIAAAAMVHAFRRLRVPTIIAYMVTGLALGPGLGLLDVAHGQDGTGATVLIAQVGIALLLFLVGLELSLDRIRDVGRVAVLAGLGQVLFTAGLGTLICRALGFDAMASVFVATALTFSSTVVVVKLLDEKQELHALYGRIAVGIFLVQDLVAIVALTVLAGLGRSGTLAAGAVAASLGTALLGMGALLVAALVASKLLLPRPFTWASRSPELLFAWSLSWCFLLVVAAGWLGLSPEIGAFLAGLSLAQLEMARDLARRVHPLMNFFVAVFFISLGAQLELAAAAEHWRAGVVLSLFVLIGKPPVFMWLIARGGYRERTSFLSSVTVAQISEFSFILAAVGLSNGFIDQATLSLIAGVGFVTIGASSYMILYNHQIYAWLRARGVFRPLGAPQGDDEEGHEPLAGHVVVVGMNPLGRAVVTALQGRGESVLAIDTDARKLAGLSVRTMIGNVEYLSVLDEAALASARLAITTLQIEEVNALFAWRCRQLGVPVAVHAFDRSVLPDLVALGVDLPLDSKREAFARIEEALRELGVVPR